LIRFIIRTSCNLQYNPIENPDQFKIDTVNLIHFLFSVAPWIEAGLLSLIPDPGNINVRLKWETARLAKARIGDRKPDERDLEDARAVGHDELRRVIFALPDERIFELLQKSGQTLTDEQKQQFLRYARRELRNDPVALEQAVADNYREGQLIPLRGGANLETALMICSVTGAFPYTNMHTKWQEIIEAREQMSETARVWSPLTKAFQGLDFRFLNNVDPLFVHRIREDRRLESFRGLLRRIGKDATEVTDIASLDSYVRDCKDALVGEHQKAQAEWDKIEESFLKWAGTGALAAFVTGHLVPNVSSLSAATLATLATLGQLFRRYLQRQQFRKANPMSVLVDLSRKEGQGVNLY